MTPLAWLGALALAGDIAGNATGSSSGISDATVMGLDGMRDPATISCPLVYSRGPTVVLDRLTD